MSAPLFTCPHCGAQDPEILSINNSAGTDVFTRENNGYTLTRTEHPDNESKYECAVCREEIEDPFDTIEII